MSNVAHASLSGSDVHEPKGISSAPLGTAYISNGSGSGTWQNVGTSSFTGMVADFAAPIAPSGWLELDGSTINTTTFAGLYAVMSITTTGTRTNSSPTVTSIADTTNFRVGYFVFGTGIISGTTIVSIDSASQITLSNNATSSGTASFAVSPWLLNTGTIQLPDATSAGRFRRSRRPGATKVGDIQVTTNLQHSHTGTATTGTESANHAHFFTGTTGTENQSHTHNVNNVAAATGATSDITFGSVVGAVASNFTTGQESQSHNHAFSGNTGSENASHTHGVTFTTDNTGDATESRPYALVFITCVKT